MCASSSAAERAEAERSALEERRQIEEAAVKQALEEQALEQAAAEEDLGGRTAAHCPLLGCLVPTFSTLGGRGSFSSNQPTHPAFHPMFLKYLNILNVSETFLHIVAK